MSDLIKNSYKKSKEDFIEKNHNLGFDKNGKITISNFEENYLDNFSAEKENKNEIDNTDKIEEDDAYFFAKNSLLNLSGWIQQTRVNQILSSLKIRPTYQNIDFKNKLRVDFYAENLKIFKNAFAEYNFDDAFRLGFSFLSGQGQVCFLFRKNYKGEHGLSTTSNFLYKYDDFGKLTYLMAFIQEKQGIETNIVVETYDVTNNLLIKEVQGSDKSEITYQNLNSVDGTAESPIPAVLIFNPFSQYTSDLIYSKDILEEYFLSKITEYRNLTNTFPIQSNVTNGGEVYLKRITDADADTRKKQGINTSLSTTFLNIGEKTSNPQYISPSLQPAIDSITLNNTYMALLKSRLGLGSYDFLITSAQKSEDSIEYADRESKQSVLQSFTILSSKIEQLMNLMWTSLGLANPIIPTIDIGFINYSNKSTANKQLLMQEYQSGLISLESYKLDNILTIQELIKQSYEVYTLYQIEEEKIKKKIFDIKGSNNKTPLENEGKIGE